MTATEEQSVLVDIDERGVARVTLNRAHVNNAYDGAMVETLLNGVHTLGADPKVRAILIDAKGKHFQAGADLGWLERVRHGSPDENLQVSITTTDAVRALDACPKPTVALVQGACFGGGTGILAACDVVIAAEDAIFSIAEVRWGLHAGPIIPQLCAAMGSRNVRRYAMTAERFNAEDAARMGLVHQVCPRHDLSKFGDQLIDSILLNGPSAITETKRIIMTSASLEISDDHALKLATSHSLQRQTDEAAEGLASFHEKRNPAWKPG